MPSLVFSIHYSGFPYIHYSLWFPMGNRSVFVGNIVSSLVKPFHGSLWHFLAMTAHVSRAVSFYFRFKHRRYTKTTQGNALILDCSLLDEDY